MTGPGIDHTVPFDALDLATVDEFARWLDGVAASTAADVVLDFGLVEFVLAVGVQALVDFDRMLLAEGRRLRIRGASRLAERVFEICGVADRWLMAAPADTGEATAMPA